MNLGAVCAAGCRVAATKAARQTFASGRLGQSTISQVVGSQRANLQGMSTASSYLISEKFVTMGAGSLEKTQVSGVKNHLFAKACRL
jgi:hypothetical protein